MAARWLAALLLALAAWVSPAAARMVLDLDPAAQPVTLKDWGDAWMDLQGTATPEQVDQDPAIAWEPTRDGRIYPLTTGRALWLRFTIPPAPDAERWYMEIPYPSVDLVTLYVQDSLGNWESLAAGDRLPVAAWPLPHRQPLLPVPVSAEVPRRLLVKIENPHSFSAPLMFISESRLNQGGQQASLILGIYFGLAALALVLAVLSAISLRDAAYGWFALSVLLMGLSQASLTGIAGLHLWPQSPAWNDAAAMALPPLAVGSLVWFMASVVSLAERGPRLRRAVTGLAAASVPVFFAITLVEPSRRPVLLLPYIAASAVGTVGLLVWSAWRGDRHARSLLAACVPVIAAGMLPLSRVAGLLPESFWTRHAMQFGIAIELPVLLVVLMLRSQQRREHRRRLQGLERIDPATGLINATVFHERLVQMIARSRRQRSRSAVLLVAITNLEQVRRDLGRPAAEELKLHVAGRLLSTAREIDTVAGLDEQHFGLLLEGPLTAEEVAEAGPRIVARCLMPYRGKPIDWVAHAHVAQALVPQDGSDAEDILVRLRALLAEVPADSRRAVFPLARPAAS